MFEIRTEFLSVQFQSKLEVTASWLSHLSEFKLPGPQPASEDSAVPSPQDANLKMVRCLPVYCLCHGFFKLGPEKRIRIVLTEPLNRTGNPE